MQSAPNNLIRQSKLVHKNKGLHPDLDFERSTYRQKAENESMDATVRLLHMLNQFPGMAYMAIFDGSWSFNYVSKGSLGLSGYSEEDLTRNPTLAYDQLIHPDDLDFVRGSVKEALRSSAPYEIVYRMFTKRGEEKWVRDMGQVVPYPERDQTNLQGYIVDITEEKRAEHRIQYQVHRLEALRKIDLAITGSFDLRVILDVLLDQVITQLNVDAADILLYNTCNQALEFAASRGLRSAILQKHGPRLGEGFAGLVALEQRKVNIPDLIHYQGDIPLPGFLKEEKFIAYYGLPLIAKGQVKGILEVYHRNALEADREWLDFMDTLAGQAAIAIDNATLFFDLQRSNIELTLAYDSTLEGWSKALELRDAGTQGHTQRVTEMTLRLAQSMRINADELPHIRRGALMHDIGKMGIPDEILLKPGPLTEEEWVVMRRHPVYAYQLLSPITSLRPALDIPYCHHEKWDGSGYPRGLKGEQIPLAARVFAVVDVWDALRSNRPYRPAWEESRALEYIREESGKHFDPRVVEAFLSLV